MQRTGGTKGTFVRYQWNARNCRWVALGQATGIFGQNGVVSASQRVQGSNQTPAGTFRLLSAFGVGNPGTRLPYTKLTQAQWWDERPSSRTYNQMINSSQGCTTNTCEHLIEETSAYGRQLYNQAVVIGYNTPVQHRSGGGSGAGIFLHFARSYTGGCVAVNDYQQLTATVAWLDPRQHPLIVIR
ncbi:MAG TPA: L,D-transpeptidase family protein [Marmoricola sp.]|nr:L,D-transpeptidase family protein [Marmoricola sp.]